MGRRNKNKLFEAVEVVDAGAKGKSIAKSPDGRVIFVTPIPFLSDSMCCS